MMMVQYLLDADDAVTYPGRRPRRRRRSPTTSLPSRSHSTRRSASRTRSPQLARHARARTATSSREQFMHWFLQEQREEVSSMSALLQVVERLEGQRACSSRTTSPASPAARTRSRPARRPPRAERSERTVVELRVRTERQSQLVDITRLVPGRRSTAPRGAAVLVYVPHTTAGVTINEHADPAVARDFETALERIVPADWALAARRGGEENAPTHIRAAFMGPSVVIPLRRRRRARARHRGRASSSASSTGRASVRRMSPSLQ